MRECSALGIADVPIFISAEDAKQLLSLDDVLASVEKAYAAGGRQQATLSSPRSLLVRSTRNREVTTLVKAAAIDDVIGARVITSGAGKMPGSRFVIIADSSTGDAQGIVDESGIFALRVGAQAALAVKHLARTCEGTLALIGSGELAGGVARCLGRLMPQIRIKTTSLNPESRRRFAAWCKQETGLAVEGAVSIEECCREVDVIVTATSARTPLIKMEHLDPGILVVSVGGGQELDEPVVQCADLVFADDIDHCRSFGSLRPHLIRNDAAFEQRVASLGDAIAGTRTGRRSKRDIIVAVPQGLASADLALAAFLLKRARERNLGIKLQNGIE